MDAVYLEKANIILPERLTREQGVRFFKILGPNNEIIDFS